MIDRLREYEVLVSIGLNPLNWQLRCERYFSWGISLHVGPVTVLVLR